ncbi:MAG: hemerythrin family protein [Spirochaetes bacterium]|nr:hemerythrin family protein [Spirochaetota bacterium]
MTSLLIETERLKIVIDPETLIRFRKFWRENDFTLGIELLDAQHMWLIALLFHLESLIAVPGEKDKKQIDAVFSEAMRYAETHFQAEELVLHEYRFPQEENHAAQHHAFKDSIRNILHAPGSNDADHASKLGRFLHNWLVQHIKKEDMAYRDFFRGNGIDANSYFQRLIAGGSEFELSETQMNLYAEVSQNNEVIPGITNEVLLEVKRMWKSFSIRLYVPLIDMQHLWLIKMVVELEEALKANYDQRLNLLIDLLPDVKSYVEEHFAAEEAMMDALGYPAAQGHKKLHEVFTRTVTSHDAEYATRTRHGAAVLVHDLKDWLLTHIVIEDAKFAKLCREKSAEAMKVSKQIIAEKKAKFKKVQILLYQYITGKQT